MYILTLSELNDFLSSSKNIKTTKKLNVKLKDYVEQETKNLQSSSLERNLKTTTKLK